MSHLAAICQELMVIVIDTYVDRYIDATQIISGAVIGIPFSQTHFRRISKTGSEALKKSWRAGKRPDAIFPYP